MSMLLSRHARRRAFIAGLRRAAAWPLSVGAQQPTFLRAARDSHMKNSVSRFFFAAILVAMSVGLAPAVAQDNFPSRPIKIVLPVPAGSALDVATRAIGEQLAGRWGQQVVIE